MRFQITLAAAIVTVVAITTGCTAPQMSSRDGEAPSFEPTVLSESEREAMYISTLDDTWKSLSAKHPNAIRPDVEIIRFVPIGDWPTAQRDCLVEAGVDAHLDTDGGLVVRVDDAQAEFTILSQYTCEAQFPLDPVANVPLNDSQLEYVYWYYTTELTACLERKGVDVSAPPSIATFKETFYTADFWSPYGSVGESVDWGEVNADCPQLAPGLFG